ncbi:transient receptor potential cation channel subfamily M member 2-like [Alosa pseudoharengus]|uniref:transient receptor potential cation channel subfamily M member 2-like n=1 Tax=Alosa pseudoharengus TaxID=34774 RepID=UPI003F8C6428
MYMNDWWNILDMASILLFIAGLGCRWISSAFYAGKVIFCIDFIIFSLRLMAIFTISRTLGPKIIIVKRMMMDLFFFMIMLSIWVVAYGVAKQGILIHNEERLDWIFRGAVYEPYLIIFGNFPTNNDKAEFDMSTCTVNGTDPMLPKCPMLNANQMPAIPEWLTIIMLCVYLLFANILLLNLLIAIFNYTFQQVQDNTDKIWKFQRYELIKEYHSRPALPPPFILLSHLFLLFRRFVMRQHPQKHKQFRKRLSKTEEEELMSWEARMKDKYVATQLQKTSESMEHRILAMADRVASMSELLEREHDRGTTAKRLDQLEEQVSQSAKALQWIMDTLKAQGYQSKEEPPSMCE